MATSATSTSLPLSSVDTRGWLRNVTFDLHFIVTIALVAIAAGCLAVGQPRLFALFLMLDVWLLGYHHVVSTFTRLCFDRASFQENKFLVIYLPVIVIVATLAAVKVFGGWVLPTTYLYWQWFHYTRQSYGIERAYRWKADKNAFIDDYVATRTLYILPIFGILYRSWQQHDTYIGMSLFSFPVPTFVVITAGVVAAIASTYWFCQQLYAYWHGRLATAHSMYVASHLAVFFVGYYLIEDITAGWLVLNIWHNAQYILFVWLFNNKRFKNEVDPNSKFLSTLSQSKHVIYYMGFCVAISTVIYQLLIQATDMSSYQSKTITVTLIALMVLNFHHYVVDGIIWKRKRLSKSQAAPAT
jgi:hypothetical protein